MFSAVNTFLPMLRTSLIKVTKRYPATGRRGPWGSGYVKTPDLPDFRHYKGGRSSAKRTGRLYPRRNPWYSFSEAESTSGQMVLSEGTTEKIPSDTTGDRSRNRHTSLILKFIYRRNKCSRALANPVTLIYVSYLSMLFLKH